MRTSRRIIVALIFGTTALAAPVFAFDGSPVDQDATIPVAAAAQPGAALALKKAIPTDPDVTSLTALEYAAEGGHAGAQSKLAQMYADGNGVAQDDVRAFGYFSRIANAHAEDSPSEPQAMIVANAFVALGRYYLTGIPNSTIKADPERAREMFSYAASYFGNADAQYDLARLFNGDQMPRQAARGLMWLTLARDSAGPDESWIKENYNKAISKASDEDRAMALQMLEHWVQGRKD
jgi:TPR repeat protein